METPPRLGRYDVIEELGAGGMGIVYLARDPSLGRLVAIKVLSVVNDEFRERFAREARSAAQLRHQHIVTIYDIGEDQGRPYIAMEYLDGETLANLIRSRRPVPPARKLELMLALCAGLGYAHRSGIIHRDIKPANVMITSDGVLKILDFGLARLANESSIGLTVAGALMGTPHYMSPEQIEGKALDHRADIFAVGVLFYELIAYRKAYPGDAWPSVFHKILHDVPQPLSELSGSVDPELERVVNQCIARDPEQRYADLSHTARDLQRILARLHKERSDPTNLVDPRDRDSGRLASGAGAGPRTPASTPGHGLRPDAMARRRADGVKAYLAKAADHLRAEDFESAVEQCEMALLLDPSAQKALELLDDANRGLENRKVNGWLAEAEDHLSHDSLSAAAPLIDEALRVRPESPDAVRLLRTLNDRRVEQERRAERGRAARAAIDRGRANLEDEAYEAAIRSANEALAHEPDNAEAHELKRQVAAAVEAQAQRREQHVRVVTDAARRFAHDHDYARAIAALDAMPFRHPSADRLRRDLVDEAARHEASVRAEADARRLAEEARKSADQQRQRERAARELESEQERLRREAERRQQEERTEAAERRRVQEQRRAQEEEEEEEERQRLEAGRAPSDDPPARMTPNDVIHHTANPDLAIERTEPPQPASFELDMTQSLDVIREVAREADDEEPRVSRRPSRVQAIVGGGILAAVLLVTVLLLRNAGPSPDSSPVTPPVEAPASAAGNPAPPGTAQGSPPTTQSTPAAPDEGTLVLDALPWAEIVQVVDAAGKKQTLPPNATTPLFLDLPPGSYDITLKNGSSRSVTARVDAGRTTRPPPVDFGQIDAAEYFNRLKW